MKATREVSATVNSFQEPSQRRVCFYCGKRFHSANIIQLAMPHSIKDYLVTKEVVRVCTKCFKNKTPQELNKKWREDKKKNKKQKKGGLK